ncbi:MFS transporter [Pochonia chlamydosporia 170]|uniref:MFS transporter n=1 Tax=Pochonia chlamydosporia 170 TaxID=1380566 RepID=A0A179F5H4_METCM|nr:MFS transporter [Pochonia chlamydosporia 170]OAQ60591.1 MFS transporter [Pochonia chlamydosporia 170]
MTTVASRFTADKGISSTSTTSLNGDIPPLGAPLKEKKSLFKRAQPVARDAIATQPSVFDDPDTAEKYHPRSDWENYHRFDPLFRWTWREEFQVIRKMDIYIMVWACIMFMALELDRANISQALTDEFLPDLHMNTNDYNLGTTVFRLSFLCAELPSQLVSKWMGPDRWIPMQISLWSIVAGSQFWLSGRNSFLATRALLGILQGGFIPDIVIYLSYFYKHTELSIRLGFFWTAMSFADILSAIFAYGLLHMRGVEGRAGWRWLFLIEGLLTLVVGILSWVLMPAGPCQTASWFRGKKGWFTEKEEKIIVNRVIREDPNKSSMHNREPVTPKLLWQSLKDYDLWPLYILGLVFQIPMIPPLQYLTLTLKGLGFGTFYSNLLTIPTTVLHVITMLGLTYLSEFLGELSLVAMLGQIWVLPFLIYMNVVNTALVNKWVVFSIFTLLLAYPNAHPIQVAWNSRNSNAVRSRTVSAACYNMFVQASATIAANIYRADDAPRYQRGNKQLLAVCCMNIVVYILTKLYYIWRNKTRDAKWESMTEEQRLEYLATTKDEGNKRLDFRFDH